MHCWTQMAHHPDTVHLAIIVKYEIRRGYTSLPFSVAEIKPTP
jgi:hypothetical protein